MKRSAPPPRIDADDANQALRYRAPALEKGLDILELISRASRPMTASMITQELGRSTSELFRMILILEHRGYIEQAANGNGYVPTSKLFTLGMDQAPTKTLLETALPVMRMLSDKAEQSCHLATRAGGEIVIVARMEAAALIGFSVRIGYRQPIPRTCSGTVLYAFQPQAVRERWEAEFQPALGEQDLARFRRRADRVLRQGHDQNDSDAVPGIIDLSAPILRGESAVAALTMPFVNKNPLRISLDEALKLVREAAHEISSELPPNDFRV
jgi:DNA-binding IclR family transcriptional regulator